MTRIINIEKLYSKVIYYLTFLTLGIFGSSCVAEIVISIPPHASLVEQLVGDRLTVHVMISPGKSLHTFDPTPSDLVKLSKAELVVVNGGVDAWIEDLIIASETQAPVIKLLDKVDLPLVSTDHDDHDGDHDDGWSHAGHHYFGPDPHFWLDPVVMIQIVDLLEQELIKVDPEGEEQYRLNATTLRKDLVILHEELSAALAEVAGQPFVAYHDAWAYFADRYDLKLMMSIEPFPGREPSLSYLKKALDSVRASGARAVFAEFQLDTRPVKIIAENAGVKLETLDPLGGFGDRQSYQDLMRYNAEMILRGLSN